MIFDVQYNNGYFIFIELNEEDEIRMAQLNRDNDTYHYIHKFYEKANAINFKVGLPEQTESGQFYFPVEDTFVKCESNRIRIKHICFLIDSLVGNNCKNIDLLHRAHLELTRLYTDNNENTYASIVKSPNGIVGVRTKFKYLVSDDNYDGVRGYTKSFIPPLLMYLKYNTLCNVCNGELSNDNVVYYIPYINAVLCEDCGYDFFNQNFTSISSNTDKDLTICRNIVFYINEHYKNKIINN